MPNDPYQIATAADLIALGETPEDYDKHFILTADIDLDPNLPGRKVFDRAVIAPEANDTQDGFQGTRFKGVFGGNSHMIKNLKVTGGAYLGLFGYLGSTARVSNLGLEAVQITGADYVGALVGNIGSYYDRGGTVTQCYSTGTVSGVSGVGGLVGGSTFSTLTHCYSTGSVSGNSGVGGLVGGSTYSTLTHCYSTGSVSGISFVGGLVGRNGSTVTKCYSTGAVSGTSYVGGLVGSGGSVLKSVWDIDTSGQSGSAWGVGLSTAEMKDAYMLGLNGFANDPNWVLDAGRDYPRLAWEGTTGAMIPEPKIDWLEGQGTTSNPYRIDTAEQLMFLGRASALWDKNFVLDADIDLDPNLPDRRVFRQAVIPTFTGVFDGKGHAILNLAIKGERHLGLFGELGYSAKVRDLGVVDVNITGSGDYVGGLVGYNWGDVTQCYSSGSVTGGSSVGGLVGEKRGEVTNCYSTSKVSGGSSVGGLVGVNCGMGPGGYFYSAVIQCYSTGAVSGNENVGGLVGNNYYGTVTQCYSTGVVVGKKHVGGLAGCTEWGTVTQCYSAGFVTGGSSAGGLVGYNDRWDGTVTACFWDMWTSHQATSAGGTGKSTSEMQTASTFLSAGWDFVDETPNGTEDIWQILEGQDYPRLRGEVPRPRLKYSGGSGEPNDPYQIAVAEDLVLLGGSPWDYSKHFILTADINLDSDLAGRWVFSEAVIGWDMDIVESDFQGTLFTGVFDGNGHTISHLKIVGGNYLGLFGHLSGEVRNLGILDVNITSSGSHVGALVGYNRYYGTVTNCYSTGTLIASEYVGGLVGRNDGELTRCYSSASIEGGGSVGGLVGCNWGDVTGSYSSATVDGMHGVGGLLGENRRTVTDCYTTSAVTGISGVGGLAGINLGTVFQCYSTGLTRGDLLFGGLMGTGSSSAATASFWDIQTSGQTASAGGTGKTTTEMQTAKTFLEAGWDFVGETANGTQDIWWINEGKDYPRLWWER